VTSNHGVAGSSPAALTKQIKHLREESRPNRLCPHCVCKSIGGFCVALAPDGHRDSDAPDE